MARRRKPYDRIFDWGLPWHHSGEKPKAAKRRDNGVGDTAVALQLVMESARSEQEQDYRAKKKI